MSSTEPESIEPPMKNLKQVLISCSIFTLIGITTFILVNIAVYTLLNVVALIIINSI